MNQKLKSSLFGVFGSVILLLIYFGILTIFNSFEHAIQQFINFWIWITLLVVGFGIQVGLFTYMRYAIKSSPGTVAATGGVSATAMVACCAHHITDVVPILGLSAAAIFLTEYQTLFMLIGVISNFVGISYMLNVMQKHLGLFKFDMKKMFFANTIISMIVFIGFLIFKVII